MTVAFLFHITAINLLYLVYFENPSKEEANSWHFWKTSSADEVKQWCLHFDISDHRHNTRQLPLRYDTTNEKQTRPSEDYSRWSCHSIRKKKKKPSTNCSQCGQLFTAVAFLFHMIHKSIRWPWPKRNGKLDPCRHRLQMNCKRNHWLFLNKPIKLVKINISHRRGFFFFVCLIFFLPLPIMDNCVWANNSFWSAGGAARSKMDERERTRWLLLLRRLQPEVLTHILVTY